MRIASKPAWRLTRRGLMAAAGGAALASSLPFRSARAADKVILRTNWLFYGSHAIFFLGIDRGLYEKNNLDVVVKQGNGSGNTVRLVANKDTDFAYASAVTRMKLAAQGAPVISVATIDATGTDAVIVNPEAGIKTFKDLEGKKVLTTAGAGVNTMFPVAAANAKVDVNKIQLTNVAESALVQSYLQGLAPAMLGGMDDKPAEIEANGGKPPLIFNYADYGV
jgi:NitT/TauT family transport system substrate-binding protein